MRFVNDLAIDAKILRKQSDQAYQSLAELPGKFARSPSETAATSSILHDMRGLREKFLEQHVEPIYHELTENRSRTPRVSELVSLAAERFPGLVPSTEQLAAERGKTQGEKDGSEVDQGIFMAHMLDHPEIGADIMAAMSQPKDEALRLAPVLTADDVVDLGVISVERVGSVGYVTIQNHQYLNAEDNETTKALETAVDLVLLDERIEVGVLRGAPATHPKWAGRRIFGAGINLTHLYNGDIGLVDFFIERELGPLNKMYRGHRSPDGMSSVEKPWIAAVDSFAIGGGCQFLLVVDHIVAETDAYFNLPASREGIIPGCGPLRLPRFMGEALSRQAVLLGRDFQVDSPEGRLLVDQVVSSDLVSDTVAKAADQLAESGSTATSANRGAMRLAAEPPDRFRSYMANYARQQAYCIYSPDLIRNLEKNWTARRSAVEGGESLATISAESAG